MKSIKLTKSVTALFLIGVLLLTIFVQNTGSRKRVIALSAYSQYWATNTPLRQSSDEAKKQLPASTNIIEEEDKIVEDFETVSSQHHPILIVLVHSVPSSFFDEPLLTVVGLPPWT